MEQCVARNLGGCHCLVLLLVPVSQDRIVNNEKYLVNPDIFQKIPTVVFTGTRNYLDRFYQVCRVVGDIFGGLNEMFLCNRVVGFS